MNRTELFNKNMRSGFYIVLAFALLLCSCSSSDKDTPEWEKAKNEIGLHINIDLPDTSSETRSERDIGNQTEVAAQPLVSDALLLFFLPEEGSELTMTSQLYRVLKSDRIVHIGGSRYALEARLKIDPELEPEKYIVVVLANGADYYTEVKQLEYQTYSEVSQNLNDNYTGRSSGNETPEGKGRYTFWGVARHPIDTSVLVQNLNIALLRDVAKTTVSIDDELFSSSGHTLASLQIFNGYNEISLFPRIDTGGEPQLPSIPYHATSTAMVQEVESHSPGERTISILHPEQDILRGSLTGNPNDDKRFIRPALIIGLNWKGSEKVYYYRLDYTADSSNNLINVKRNRHYLINITAVKGPGADTPQQAYNTLSTTIEASIIPWEDFNSDVAIDGTNWIAVTRTVYLSSNKGSEAVLSFQTNVDPSQWEMAWKDERYESEEEEDKNEENEDGFSFTKDDTLSSSDGVFSVTKGDNLVFKALESLPNGVEKRAKQLYIKVTPRLHLVINVVQNSESSSDDKDDWDDQNIFGFL